VELPDCSTSPPIPGRILNDANLDEAEPRRSEAVSLSAKPATLPFATGFRCQSNHMAADKVNRRHDKNIASEGLTLQNGCCKVSRLYNPLFLSQ
jgi:hypothetical protein